jgi:hypothetical protein
MGTVPHRSSVHNLDNAWIGTNRAILSLSRTEKTPGEETGLEGMGLAGEMTDEMMATQTERPMNTALQASGTIRVDGVNSQRGEIVMLLGLQVQ